jgi:hypothetical protein
MKGVTFSEIMMSLLPLLMAALLSVMITTTTEEVYAQVQYSPAAQNILDLVQSDCERVNDSAGVEILPTDCVAIKHESPNLVVLDAKMYFGGSNMYENSWIWDAVNGFILQGYNVDSVVLPGQGSNDFSQREVLVVMSKP